MVRYTSSSVACAPPQISVIIPVKNGACFIAEAIQSMIAQTLKPFEIIVIDDGSTDKTFEIVQKISHRYSTVKIFKSRGEGISSALNFGIALSSGNWLARMDADDISYPKRLEEQFEYAYLNNLDIVGCNCELFGAIHGKANYPENHNACRIKQVIASPVAHPTALIDRRVFEVLSYRSGFDKVEDYDLWERAFKNGYRFGNIQKYLLKYRVHSEQVTGNDHECRLSKAHSIRVRSLHLVMPHWTRQQACEVIDFIFYKGHPSKKNINLLVEFLQCFNRDEVLMMLPYLRSAFLRRPGRFIDVIIFWYIYFKNTKKFSVFSSGTFLIFLTVFGQRNQIRMLNLYHKFRSYY